MRPAKHHLCDRLRLARRGRLEAFDQRARGVRYLHSGFASRHPRKRPLRDAFAQADRLRRPHRGHSQRRSRRDQVEWRRRPEGLHVRRVCRARQAAPARAQLAPARRRRVHHVHVRFDRRAQGRPDHQRQHHRLHRCRPEIDRAHRLPRRDLHCLSRACLRCASGSVSRVADHGPVS